MIKVYSGRFLTLAEANLKKEEIIKDEVERLDGLKDLIANFIRKSDGSDQSKQEISAMTASMHNAKTLTHNARELSIQDFFEQCPLNTCKI